MAITININGTVTYDESVGAQVGGVAVGQEDNNDNDVAIGTLPSAFSTRLFNALQLNLSNTLATSISVAKSADDYITLTGSGSVVSLNFTTSAGAALPVYAGVATGGAASNLVALDGGAISLFADASLGGRLVLGVDADNDIVFALFLDPNATLTSAKVWMVQFEALDNPDDADFDDMIAMTGLGVGAGVSTAFDFNALPSGQNLFGTVGNSATALIVYGIDTHLNADGSFTNTSDTVNTSKGGGPTTIGIDNQMFDPGDGAFFTFVKNPVTNFLAGAPGGLDQNEADLAGNMQYTGGTLESDGGFVQISQIQGNSLATMTIAAYNIDGSPQGAALIAESGQAEDLIALDRIVVKNAAGQVLEDSDIAGPQNPNINITIDANGIATITGLGAGYKVEFYTASQAVKFDQVKITGVAGKFDIGGFGVNEATGVTKPLTGVQFEDDGPSVDLVLSGTAELRVDESKLNAVDTIDIGGVGGLLSTNLATFGTDGDGGGGAPEYKLTLGADVTSGLLDTATGLEVILSINAGGTLISGKVDDGGLVDVFTIAIDPSTGTITLTQMRALVNGDPTDGDEADTPLGLAVGTVGVQRTVTDGDDDTASDTVDISPIFKFEDAEPSLQPAGEAVPDLITDDTDIGVPSSDTVSTDDIFPLPPIFGSDGPNADDPIVYSLRVQGTDPNSGLVDTATGRAILLKKIGADVVGIVDTNGNGAIDLTETTVAIRYSLSDAPDPADPQTEIVTFTQYRSVVHGNINDPNESTTPETITAGLVFIDQTAIDGDDDVSAKVSFDLASITQLLDDGPTIGPIPDGVVDLTINDFVTNSLLGDVNNDPKTSPYTITDYTASLTVGGVPVHGVLAANAQSVKYWADTNGDTIFGNPGDTAYYELTLNQTANSGAGSYTFTVLIDPPPALTEFDFSDLPSGQNLFGAIARDKTDLDGLVLFVLGKNADINDPGDGQMTNTSSTVNTSKGGGPVTIGNTNQMIDPGEGTYFAYLSDAVTPMIAGVTGGLTQNSADDADTIGFGGTIGAHTAQVEIVQVQGGGTVTMDIKAYDLDLTANYGADGVVSDAEARDFVESPLLPADDPVNIIAVRVYNASGVLIEEWVDPEHDGTYANPTNSASVNVQFLATGVADVFYARVSGVNDDYMIEFETETQHDMALVEGVAGKFDIGGFNIIERQDIPDNELAFEVTVTDGDGDTASDDFTIGIDGTGQYDNGIIVI
ncbi:DUF5801 domain-containing protein [Sphingomonas sp. NSE70-1]|uniref:DUF5801 domain-containing protein n=1 Tax=Sphingomonas caseinilyticus TaxID=2908205 RepID=A0ABT0RUC8_9SPHN|nr:DUF5801 repeats-in-toxin domain-containing protein [Sphingomonas caseinilyticus]MCL6698608.1 DUF5801 domain-containing protein [Sphingomonas caseinilyticus]